MSICFWTEEEFLKNKFGETYLNWAKKTPIIVPRFSSFVKSEYSFNWKKVLRQEKNGFAALMIIFCMFDIAGELIKKQPNINETLQSFGIFSVLAYLVLKFIKYRTKLLQDPF
ncbi:MAG TPA: hypothetical protein PLN99_13410 [Daejeonella sp.]|nr:hypothetical protein [Daejeonella sp.]